MDYQQIRPTIKSGDLLVWSHIGIRSWYEFKIWLIRLFLQTEYTHIGTAWVIGDRVFVIEAVSPLVRIYPLSKLGNFYHLPLNAPWYKDTESVALSKVGHEYSQLQAIQSPFGEPPKDNLWQCAELVANIAECDGIDLGSVYTPAAIVLSAQKRGSTLTYVYNESGTN